MEEVMAEMTEDIEEVEVIETEMVREVVMTAAEVMIANRIREEVGAEVRMVDLEDMMGQ